MMIDTWLVAILILTLLLAVALIRVIRIRSRYERLVSAVVAIALVSAWGLLVSIALGTLIVLDISVFVVLVCYAVLIVHLHVTRGEAA